MASQRPERSQEAMEQVHSVPVEIGTQAAPQPVPNEPPPSYPSGPPPQYFEGTYQPPAYQVATELPTYEEAERTKG